MDVKMFPLPVDDSVLFWVGYDGCDTKPETETSESGNVIKETYTGGEDGTEVVLVTIVNEGHAWPGGKAYRGGKEPTSEISANYLMWDFFKAHPKR